MRRTIRTGHASGGELDWIACGPDAVKRGDPLTLRLVDRLMGRDMYEAVVLTGVPAERVEAAIELLAWIDEGAPGALDAALASPNGWTVRQIVNAAAKAIDSERNALAPAEPKQNPYTGGTVGWTP